MKHRTGYLHQRGKKKRWYVSWRIDGKLHVKALRTDDGQPITTKRDAEEARDRFMAPLALADEAEALSAIAGKANTAQARAEDQTEAMTLARAWSEYLASTKRPDTGPDTLAIYEGQFGQFTKWMGEKHPDVTTLRGVADEIAEEYAGTLNHGKLAPGTYNKHLNVLTLVFRVLADKARVASNPWQGIQRKRLEVHSRRELTLAELQRLCQSAQGEMRTLIALGIYAGLRLKDCATLKWGEIDMTRGIITRVPSKTARRNPKPVIVPMHSTLRDMLADTPDDKRQGYVLPATADKYRQHKKNLVNEIQAHFKACGIETHNTDPVSNRKLPVVLCGFHSLRHSFVSMCRAADVPLSVVESIVGHSNPAMTKHYTHTGLPAAQAAVALLPAMLDDGKAKAIKAAPESVCAQLKAIVRGIKPANLAEKKAALLALLKD